MEYSERGEDRTYHRFRDPRAECLVEPKLELLSFDVAILVAVFRAAAGPVQVIDACGPGVDGDEVHGEELYLARPATELGTEFAFVRDFIEGAVPASRRELGLQEVPFC
jgi:hypothetical protein